MAHTLSIGTSSGPRRKFCSYGTADKDLHYYVPRQALVDYACPAIGRRKSGQGRALYYGVGPPAARQVVGDANVIKISQSGVFAGHESGHAYPNAPDACMRVNIRGWPTRLNLMTLAFVEIGAG